MCECCPLLQASPGAHYKLNQPPSFLFFGLWCTASLVLSSAFLASAPVLFKELAVTTDLWRTIRTEPVWCDFMLDSSTIKTAMHSQHLTKRRNWDFNVFHTDSMWLWGVAQSSNYRQWFASGSVPAPLQPDAVVSVYERVWMVCNPVWADELCR